MTNPGPLWLVVNNASGSYSDDSEERLQACCAAAGMGAGAGILRTVNFPGEDLPSAAELDAAGVRVLAVFTGDGTLNTAIARLEGWQGAVLPLPGGTMNLLSKRLHSDQDAETILTRYCRGEARLSRPQVVTTAHGSAFAELLAGPGTRWNIVREALREADLPGVVAGTADAIAETYDGPNVHVIEPAGGREEGYPLIEVLPTEVGLQVKGFYAETVGDVLSQGAALLRRNFREGPHDDLGLFAQITLRQTDGSPIELLFDGEPVTGGAREVFGLAPCRVDLLATPHDD
ncbi:diacylglycerol kinase family protein [Allopontixanthobacter sp.]|uniref:diacylglycerol kinase family protein n=1 Tax=Allopontixanthobacter sp. TaxID=2906452 RepID=UPI002ABCA22C|nr:diacylglycerol kinase family protein [Allopontixanthobacter sp.]MDZ4308506.1 diacylglycerol kinase family protein [Allopontixanthobacter sp.]